jgi:RNA polymerase sigma-70 factor (ECF subfamily)
MAIEPATAEFERSRGRLFGLAYGMLGSRADAEDLVQEAWLRWHQVQGQPIENPEAWLVTATSRLAIDRLRRLRTEREAYVGPWLPEPILTSASPDRALDLTDDLSIAFMTLLERLAHEERVAFLLHDVFDVGYDTISTALDRSEDACRQVVHRARGRLRADRKRFEATDEAKKSLLERFLAAMEAQDERAIADLFAPDATWTVDGGGRVAAVQVPVIGASEIARRVARFQDTMRADGRRLQIATINGETGLCIRENSRCTAVITIATDGDRILNVYTVLNPDKLA